MVTKTKTSTIGQYLLDQLQANGVEHIFGVPGDYILRFDKIIEEHPIQFINATRENTAGLMADAYGRMRGMGVACTTYGVGINITNAVSQAFVENSPLVVISGAASTEEFASSHNLHHMFQSSSNQLHDTTQMKIFKKITVAQTLLDNPQTAQEQIDWVLAQCLQEKKPVYIEIPRDQVESTFIPTPHKTELNHCSDHEALEEVLEEAANMLKNSEKPVIWIGHEIQRYGLTDAVMEFAEKYRIPIASSLLGKTAISEFHPLYMGIYQGDLSIEEVRDYVESSDAIFIFGVILNELDTGFFTSDLKQKQKITATNEEIRVNHHCYDDVYFNDLIKGLANLELNIRFRTEYPACIDRKLPPFSPEKGKEIKIDRLFNCIQKNLRTEHVVVSDFGDSLFGSSELILEQDSFLSNSYFATLGFGVPASIGASLALPQRRVVGIIGDGAFQMTCTELSTALRYHADPVIILLNNHGYATERPFIDGEFNNIHGWKYSKMPLLLGGGTGSYVKTEDQLEKALNKALDTRGEFHLIEVELGKTDISPALQRFTNFVTKKGRE